MSKSDAQTSSLGHESLVTSDHFLHILRHRYKHKVAFSLPNLPSEIFQNLTESQKHKKAHIHFKEAEKKLKEGHFDALSDYHFATLLAPANPKYWHKKAQAFLEFALLGKQENFFHQALKSSEEALKLDKNAFHYLWTKANILYEIGLFSGKENYFLLAKDWIAEAIEKAENQPKSILAELYWDQGLMWAKIADISGEAIDVRKSIQAYRLSFVHQNKVSAAFWLDFGHAYAKMGLLINDNSTLHQAIDFFEKAAHLTPESFDIWLALADCFSHLYYNTLNQKFFDSAYSYFKQCETLSPSDSEMLQKWTCLLLDYGTRTSDPKKLELCVAMLHPISQQPKNREAKLKLIEALSWLGVFSNNVEHIQEAQKIIDSNLTHSLDLFLAKAINHLAFSEYFHDINFVEKAIKELETHLACDPNHLKALLLLGKSYQKLAKEHNNSQFAEKAIEIFKKIMHIKPSFLPHLYDYAACSYEAFELTNETTYLHEALVQFEKLLEGQTDTLLHHPDWLSGYAKALCHHGEIFGDPNTVLKAVDIFSHVLLLNPDYAKIHFNIALAYAKLSDNFYEFSEYGQAWKFFELALRQNPEDDEAYLEWGLSLLSYAELQAEGHKTEIFIQAEQKLFSAAKLGNEFAIYYLACLFALTKQHDLAIDWLLKAEKHGILPTTQELLEDEWLKELHGNPKFQHFCAFLEKKSAMIQDK